MGCALCPGVQQALPSSLRARPTLPSFPAPHTLTTAGPPASTEEGDLSRTLGNLHLVYQTQDKPHFPPPSIRQSRPGQLRNYTCQSMESLRCVHKESMFMLQY